MTLCTGTPSPGQRCNRPDVIARGLCQKCYTRFRRTGSTEQKPMGRHPVSAMSKRLAGIGMTIEEAVEKALADAAEGKR
jgi:hypothetical protein